MMRTKKAENCGGPVQTAFRKAAEQVSARKEGAVKMMVIGGVGPAGSAGHVQARQVPKSPVFSEMEPERKFDQVVVSENSFRKQLLGRLSQEVRAAATTTGTVAALRGQVRANEYQVDPQAIARRLLFVWD